jgi:alkylation response protein AidB-like acyl-CoA dehydrogenase
MQLASDMGLPTADAVQSPPIVGSVDEAVKYAGELKAGIATRCADVEAERRISDASIAELKRSGLFGLVGSRGFGGSEVGVEALVRVTIEIAETCGSTGWVFGVLAGHSWMLNLFPPQAQEEVAALPGALTATLFRLAADVTATEGGFLLKNGSGRFCSGVDFADWIIASGAVKGEGGQVEPRFFLLPRSEIEIIDDWFTVGMRGTGSRSIKVAEAFIPEHRSVRVTDMVKGLTPGAAFHDKPIYRLPFGTVTPFSIAGAPLGMARGAVKAFADSLQTSIGANPSAPGRDEMLVALSRASAVVDAAILVVLADAAKIDRVTDPEAFGEIQRRELPRNWSWAVQACRKAVNDLYALSGGSAIYNNSTLQRFWRDINSAAQHVGFAENKAMVDFGLAQLGLPEQPYVIPSK